MTFVHTFYSEPLYKNKFAKFEESLNNILWDYGLSLMFIKKFGHKIKLVTDSRGKELFSCLPYDEVIVLEDIDTNPHFAASFKFYALKILDLEDILIDGDIIIDNKKAFDVIRLAKQDVVHSFVEKNDYIFRDLRPNNDYTNQTEYYTDLFNKMRTVEGFRYELPKLHELEYPNTSLIKITNQDLKDEWVDQYFYHMNLMKDIDFGSTWPDIIIEQYFLKCVIDENGFSRKAIIEHFPEGTKWEKEMGFTHLGNMKTHFLNVIKYRLKEKDQELYVKIENKIKEEIKNAVK